MDKNEERVAKIRSLRNNFVTTKLQNKNDETEKELAERWKNQENIM